MKEIIKYVADDGTAFDTEKECIDYEKSIREYVIHYKDSETNLFSQRLDDESSVKRLISGCLHDCYKDNLVGIFKIFHRGKTVEFNSTELREFVPAHYKINGTKLNEVFQLLTTKNVKIPGYTLHGDYYLADNVIPNTTWEQACKMAKIVILPNGKRVIAHTLSKEELETIPVKERGVGVKCYWTSTPADGDSAWFMGYYGIFGYDKIYNKTYYNGIRLGFKNPFKS